MALMVLMGALLVVGLVLAGVWGGTTYTRWPAEIPDVAPSNRFAATRYLRGVAIVLTAGFWAGALVTGPAMRLTMRLLAVTAGDRAQGALTEAEEVVGDVDLDGTIALHIFGGILPGLLSAAIYLLVRRWLPGGRLGAALFGLLHLAVAATRVDPLRPDNPDFGLLGPGWLAVVAFGAASIVHGMAVIAFANRYSAVLPPPSREKSAVIRAIAPLFLPALFLVPGAFLLIPIAAGMVVAIVLQRTEGLRELTERRQVVVAGRLATIVLTLLLLPGTVRGLAEIITSS